MVEPSDTRNRDDLPHFAPLDRPLFRGVFVEPEMGSVRVVVINV